VGCPADPVGLAQAAGAGTLVLNYRYVNRELVEDARQREIGVIVWNIDDPGILEHYLDLNLEAICTNRPREIINYLSRPSIR
jgi:glycerophosphoryl diester phosphodiesterase